MSQPAARRPQRLSEYALACLQALAAHGLGRKVSVGGALGLAHYADRYPTPAGEHL